MKTIDRPLKAFRPSDVSGLRSQTKRRNLDQLRHDQRQRCDAVAQKVAQVTAELIRRGEYRDDSDVRQAAVCLFCGGHYTQLLSEVHRGVAAEYCSRACRYAAGTKHEPQEDDDVARDDAADDSV